MLLPGIGAPGLLAATDLAVERWGAVFYADWLGSADAEHGGITPRGQVAALSETPECPRESTVPCSVPC